MSTVIPRFEVKQGDRRPSLIPTLFQGGNIVDLTTATNAYFTMTNEAGSVVIDLAAMTILTPATNGQVSYAWQTADTETAGLFQGEVKIVWADGTPERFPNDGNFEVVITANLA